VSERVRLVVVDDHQLFRAGVRAELSAHCDVVGEAATPAEALAVIAATRPRVVLLDVHLPDGGGVAVQRALAGEPEPPAVLALSVSDAAEDVVPMIRAGALGYVTKTIATVELVDAIERVAGGDAYFSPRLAAFVLAAFSDVDPAGGRGPDAQPDSAGARGAASPRPRLLLQANRDAARYQCADGRVPCRRRPAQAAAQLTARGQPLGGLARPDR
jgi:DNA-binding NarL/FixJ family response regulator